LNPKNPKPNTSGLKPFVKGQSGNPAGRPPIISDIREKAKEHAGEALQALIDVARSKDSPPSARVSAAAEILNRGFGRPSQSIDATISGRFEPAAMHLEALRELAERGKALRLVASGAAADGENHD
jgi:hypothetical protein